MLRGRANRGARGRALAHALARIDVCLTRSALGWAVISETTSGRGSVRGERSLADRNPLRSDASPRTHAAGPACCASAARSSRPHAAAWPGRARSRSSNVARSRATERVTLLTLCATTLLSTPRAARLVSPATCNLLRTASDAAGNPLTPAAMADGDKSTPAQTRMAMLRLASDLRAIQADPPSGCSASPATEDNLFLWNATIIGPDESPWEGAGDWVQSSRRRRPSWIRLRRWGDECARGSWRCPLSLLCPDALLRLRRVDDC